MRDPDSGVEVDVRRYISKHPYTEYDTPPGSPLYPLYNANFDLSLTRHIEAITEHTFQIGVVLPAGFDFKGCAWVRVSVSIGGHQTVYSRCVSAVEKGHNKEFKLIIWSTIAKYQGTWHKIRFTFGRLLPGTLVSAPSDEFSGALLQRGVINVHVERGWASASPVNEVEGKPLWPLLLKPSTELPEQYGKTHSILPRLRGPAARPIEYHTFHAADEMDGMVVPKIKFAFCCASREMLKKKGIIPTAPAPLPTPPSSALPSTQASETSFRTGPFGHDSVLSSSAINDYNSLTQPRASDHSTPQLAAGPHSLVDRRVRKWNDIRINSDVEKPIAMRDRITDVPFGSRPGTKSVAAGTHSLSTPAENKRCRRENSIVVIDDDGDDEEELPRKKVKTESAADVDGTSEMAPDEQLRSLKEEEETIATPMPLPARPVDNQTDSPMPAPTLTSQTVKEKERKERRSIKLKLQELQLQQRLIDLED